MHSDNRVSGLMGRDEKIRKAYAGDGIYKPETICLKLEDQAPDYMSKLLREKMSMVRNNHNGGVLLDLCCAAGSHLLDLSDVSDECLGIDFSEAFVRKATRDKDEQKKGHVRFCVGDAKKIPLQDSSVGTIYSFSSLYAIPDVKFVLAEVSRVLRPGGRCVLDMGNSRSINTYCVRHYTEIPETYPIPTADMLQSVSEVGLRLIERRSFQLLPLWAGKPRWLWPILHPMWTVLMAKSYRGKMLDEWLSNLPVMRHFAFRQILVCEKPE